LEKELTDAEKKFLWELEKEVYPKLDEIERELEKTPSKKIDGAKRKSLMEISSGD
jgi:hypothetical protein